jgi:lysophospholipase L1-like esterase
MCLRRQQGEAMTARKASKRLKVIRGYEGDVTGGRHSELYAFYRFEIPFPDFTWQIDQNLGQTFVDWAEEKIDGPVVDVLKRDANKLDVPLGFLMETGSFELAGEGTRVVLPNGEPDWSQATYHPIWSMVRNYNLIQRELASKLRAVGDNDTAQLLKASGAKLTGSEPIFFKPKVLIWRIGTNDLGSMGALAQEFFIEQNTKRKLKTLEKMLAAKKKAKRSAAAKKVWKKRKAAERVIEKLEAMKSREEREVVRRMFDVLSKMARYTAKEERETALLMHEQLIKLAGLMGKHASNRNRGRNTKRVLHGKKAKKTRHQNRRNLRPRG